MCKLFLGRKRKIYFCKCAGFLYDYSTHKKFTNWHSFRIKKCPAKMKKERTRTLLLADIACIPISCSSAKDQAVRMKLGTRHSCIVMGKHNQWQMTPTTSTSYLPTRQHLLVCFLFHFLPDGEPVSLALLRTLPVCRSVNAQY